MTRDEARETAVQTIYEQQRAVWDKRGGQFPSTMSARLGYDLGYAAGLSAQRDWVKIDDGLPENPNPWPVQVLVIVEINSVNKICQTAKFHQGQKDEWTHDGGKPLQDEMVKVIAWCAIPDYSPTEAVVKESFTTETP